MQLFNGIDVSHHQGIIDWGKVKSTGKVDFAIIRASYGYGNPNQIDRQLDANARGCEKAGIPYGFYHYSYSKNEYDATQEAAFFLSAIKNYNPTMPLVFDFEDPCQLNLGYPTMRNICKTFLSEVERAGYYAMLYSYASLLKNLDGHDLDVYDKWVAHINVETPNYHKPHGMWQYSWKGKIDGINGDVDLNYAYFDYPKIIKEMKQESERIPELEMDASEEIEHWKILYEMEKSAHDRLKNSLKKLLEESI